MRKVKRHTRKHLKKARELERQEHTVSAPDWYTPHWRKHTQEMRKMLEGIVWD